MVCRNDFGKEEEELQTKQLSCKRYLRPEKHIGGGGGEKCFKKNSLGFFGE